MFRAFLLAVGLLLAIGTMGPADAQRSGAGANRTEAGATADAPRAQSPRRTRRTEAQRQRRSRGEASATRRNRGETRAQRRSRGEASAQRRQRGTQTASADRRSRQAPRAQ